MVQSAEYPGLLDLSEFGKFNFPRHRTLLLQPNMSPRFVIVADVLGQHSVQMSRDGHLRSGAVRKPDTPWGPAPPRSRRTTGTRQLGETLVPVVERDAE